MTKIQYSRSAFPELFSLVDHISGVIPREELLSHEVYESSILIRSKGSNIKLVFNNFIPTVYLETKTAEGWKTEKTTGRQNVAALLSRFELACRTGATDRLNPGSQ